MVIRMRVINRDKNKEIIDDMSKVVLPKSISKQIIEIKMNSR